MRARAVAGVLAAALVVAAQGTAAQARDRLVRVPLAATGSIKVEWTGVHPDCEGAGMCEFGGTISLGHALRGSLEQIAFAHDPYVDVSGDLDLGRGFAHSHTFTSGGDGCNQRTGLRLLFLHVRPAYRGRLRLSLAAENAYPTPAPSGQCAGPRMVDIAGSLPSAVFRMSRMRRTGARLSLAGSFPFRSGPIAGRVVSTVRLRSRREHVETLRGGDGGPGHARSRRVMLVSVDYRVRRVAGAVTADFRSVAPPVCVQLDACGTSGRDRYGLSAAGEHLRVSGLAPLKGRVPKPAAAVRAIARRGVFYGSTRLGSDRGTTTSTWTRPDDTYCSDAFTPGASSLELTGSRLGPGLTLGEGVESPTPNVLRGRCPGPTQEDILGGSSLAGARLAKQSLGRRHIHRVLRASGAFAAGAYRGKRGARVTVDLVRVHRRVQVIREFGPDPFAGGSAGGA